MVPSLGAVARNRRVHLVCDISDGLRIRPAAGCCAVAGKNSPRVDDFLTEQTATGKVPGAILLIQRHGKPVYFKWFGKRDVDANIEMTPDTIFPLHSVTKTVTSVAAMMLVDRGRIALDDPVSNTSRRLPT